MSPAREDEKAFFNFLLIFRQVSWMKKRVVAAAAEAWRHGWCRGKEWGKINQSVLTILFAIDFLCRFLSRNTYILDGIL